jgi:hypothetical protein
LLTGLIIGLILGLVYAWLISPREYRDTYPADLRASFKDQFRAMIAVAYTANGNLPRALERLDYLGDENIARSLAEQAQRTLAEGNSPREAQALGLLAVAVGQGGTPATLITTNSSTPLIAIPASTGSIQTTPFESPIPSSIPTTESSPSPVLISPTVSATREALATGTPLPTRTPTPTLGAPFVIKEKNFICDQKLVGPLLQVLVEDQSGVPLSSVEAIVTWDGGEDHFFTGLKPELGTGYSDFVMTPGVVYTIRLAEGSEIVLDLTPSECETPTGSRYWGSWLLRFARP